METNFLLLQAILRETWSNKLFVSHVQ